MRQRISNQPIVHMTIHVYVADPAPAADVRGDKCRRWEQWLPWVTLGVELVAGLGAIWQLL